MKISIGADHAGFLLKELLRRTLAAEGHEVTDHGTGSDASCDYPVFAAAVGRDVAGGAADRGILVCGSGIGMCIAANKISGIRAAVGTSVEQVRLTREHNNINILTLGGRMIDQDAAERMVEAFFATQFLGQQHARRVAQIAELEQIEHGAK